jgi:hypothetical protein
VLADPATFSRFCAADLPGQLFFTDGGLPE